MKPRVPRARVRRDAIGRSRDRAAGSGSVRPLAAAPVVDAGGVHAEGLFAPAADASPRASRSGPPSSGWATSGPRSSFSRQTSRLRPSADSAAYDPPPWVTRSSVPPAARTRQDLRSTAAAGAEVDPPAVARPGRKALVAARVGGERAWGSTFGVDGPDVPVRVRALCGECDLAAVGRPGRGALPSSGPARELQRVRGVCVRDPHLRPTAPARRAERDAASVRRVVGIDLERGRSQERFGWPPRLEAIEVVIVVEADEREAVPDRRHGRRPRLESGDLD